MRRLILSILSLLLLYITGCGSSNGGGTSTSPNIKSGTVIIGNAGLVPVLNGGTTTSVIYVHNNSNHEISNIQYTATLDDNLKYKLRSSQNKNSYTTFLNPQSIAICSKIAAGASCPLEFTTPPLEDHVTEGSATVTLSYDSVDGPASFSQLVNFAELSSPQEGINFASGVDISGFGNPTGYATVYLYAGGTDQIYTVDSLTSDKPSVSIINGNITGQQMASGYVQAVEISSSIPTQNAISAKLAVNSSSSLRSQSYSSTSSVGVVPANSGGILVAGQIPVINTANQVSPSGSLTILNSGNATVTLGTTSATTGISNLSGCTSGSTLTVGQTCTITFNVTQSNGNGTITLNYTGGSSATSVTQAVTWYNSLNGALVNMNYTTPLSFPQTTTTTSQVTVTNIGGYNLTGVSIPTPTVLSGSATVTVSYPSSNSCQNATLNVGASCQFNLNITDAVVEANKQILFGISGSYNNGTSQTYTRNAIITYTSISLAPNLTISPSPALQMTIEGNNVESATQTLTINNAGNAPATISSQGMTSTYSNLFTTTNCSSPLESNTSCTVTVKLNPYSATTQVSGNGTYQITYSGGTSSNLTTTDSVPFTITQNQQSVSLSQPVATGSSSGNGESANTAYNFAGSVTNQIITLTFTNTGSNPITITGFQNTNSTLAWSLNLAQSTCYTADNLAVGATCTIIFNNVLNQNTLAISGLGSSYTENLIVPTIIFKDDVATGTQFQVQPTLPTGGVTVYAVASLATIANSVTVLNPGTTNTQLRIQSTLTNATGYVPIALTANMEDYFSGVVTTAGGCTQTSSLAIRTQNCTLSTSNTTGSITYQIESGFITTQSVNLHTLFEMNAASQAVGMSPIYTTTNIPQQ